METKRYVIRDREAGNIIDSYETKEEAKRKLDYFEYIDKQEGIYEPNFYEIYDTLEEREI